MEEGIVDGCLTVRPPVPPAVRRAAVTRLDDPADPEYDLPRDYEAAYSEWRSLNRC